AEIDGGDAHSRRLRAHCGFALAQAEASYTWACDAGWSSQVARRAHNPEVAGSNPAPATHEGSGNRALPRWRWRVRGNGFAPGPPGAGDPDRPGSARSPSP